MRMLHCRKEGDDVNVTRINTEFRGKCVAQARVIRAEPAQRGRRRPDLVNDDEDTAITLRELWCFHKTPVHQSERKHLCDE